MNLNMDKDINTDSDMNIDTNMDKDDKDTRHGHGHEKGLKKMAAQKIDTFSIPHI